MPNILAELVSLIGFPWETREEIDVTLQLVHRLRDLGCQAFVGNAIPVPGTKLYDKAKEQGFLRFDGEDLFEVCRRWEKPRPVHALSSPYWTPEEIVQICLTEHKQDYRNSIRRHAFTRRGLRKLLRNPLDSLKILRKSL
jgi:radical SAM superfamily enzyme YgiQ (UPF0313 family)